MYLYFGSLCTALKCCSLLCATNILPASSAAAAVHRRRCNSGGAQAPPGVERDDSCAVAERDWKSGGSNASQCLNALKARKALDEKEARALRCDKTAALAHTWWDGPLALGGVGSISADASPPSTRVEEAPPLQDATHHQTP